MAQVQIKHRFINVAGDALFYREAGPDAAPTLLLLHGFPSSSHQYRGLMQRLATRFHVIAPDYPGSGASVYSATEKLSFERLAERVGAFVEALEIPPFFLYMFDFGGPVGMRLALRHPAWIRGLIVQNANAYVEGLSPLAQEFVQLREGVAGAREKALELLTLEVTRSQYLTGARQPEHIAPDGYLLDQYFLEQPGRKQRQADLMLDYHENVARYPAWQAWLREHQPPSLVLWGKNDPFFLEAGAHAYRRDLPNAELYSFDTGHFALEEELEAIAQRIEAFLAARAAL
jgi:pimeloyl-ACP methyl ester carboxylesterase